MPKSTMMARYSDNSTTGSSVSSSMATWNPSEPLVRPMRLGLLASISCCPLPSGSAKKARCRIVWMIKKTI